MEVISHLLLLPFFIYVHISIQFNLFILLNYFYLFILFYFINKLDFFHNNIYYMILKLELI